MTLLTCISLNFKEVWSERIKYLTTDLRNIEPRTIIPLIHHHFQRVPENVQVELSISPRGSVDLRIVCRVGKPAYPAPWSP